MTTIKYQMADGRIVEIEVPDDVAEMTVAFKTEDDNYGRKARWRKEKSIDAMAEYGAEVADRSQDLEAATEQTEQQKRLRAAIDKLKPRQQQLVEMRYFQGLSVTQIARLTGVTKGAISQQLDVIHKKLKKLLEKT